jgi:hypothetical protein
VLTASIIRAIALIMKAASISETSVNFYQTTRRNNTEDIHLRTRRPEKFKSHKVQCDLSSVVKICERPDVLAQPPPFPLSDFSRKKSDIPVTEALNLVF